VNDERDLQSHLRGQCELRPGTGDAQVIRIVEIELVLEECSEISLMPVGLREERVSLGKRMQPPLEGGDESRRACSAPEALRGDRLHSSKHPR